MKLDSAVVKLLSLDPANTTVSSHGGGGCSSASTSKITSRLEDGTEVRYFMKIGDGKEAETMFAGEHASLNAIHDAVPGLCPRSYGNGALSNTPSKHFLVTQFMDLSARSSGSPTSTAPSLAQKIAKLHKTPAPIPPGHSSAQFGFPVPTCCGDTAQENGYTASWADFYAEHRLRFILRQSEKSNGPDKELRDVVNKTADAVVPRLLGDNHLNRGRGIKPVTVHGDLWSGNAGRGILEDMKGGPEEVVFDPSACYAHNEYELGIMKMFGGFGRNFFDEYHQLVPKTEPVEEYEDRVKLYELYHHLNHHAMFGGGYRSGALSIMKGLNAKYGATVERAEL